VKPELILYTRKECCLCVEMKETVRRVTEHWPAAVEEIDVDSAPELQAQYGDEVPVLLINGRKAFKYRLTAKELERSGKRRQPDIPQFRNSHFEIRIFALSCLLAFFLAPSRAV
jgi:glutaredoxin